MPLRSASFALLAAMLSAVGVAGCGDGARHTARPPAPSALARTTLRIDPTEHVLLGRPDPARGTQRGIFLRDPAGGVDAIAATGHLVAWAARTPADTISDDPNHDPGDGPITAPKRSKVVIVDERGGKPLVLDVGARTIQSLSMLRGAAGASEPQVSFEACRGLKHPECTASLVTLTPSAPLRAVRLQTGDRAAEEAVGGSVDSGRRTIDGPIVPREVFGPEYRSGGTLPCNSRTRVQVIATGQTTTLPEIPVAQPGSPCLGLFGSTISWPYVFVTADTETPKYGFEDYVVFAIDVSAGRKAHWRDVQAPYRYTDGSTGFEIGPAITDHAQYWEETNEDDGTMYSFERVELPADLDRALTEPTKNESDAVAPGTTNACAIAATESAIYELANTRCAQRDPQGGSTAQIRRIVAPAFHAPQD